MQDHSLVFVYGTLMKDLGNHDLLEQGQARPLGRWLTGAGFRLIDLQAFPGLIRDPASPLGERVYGELYEVDALTLDRLDRLEGHPNFYRRERIAVAPLDLAAADPSSRYAWAYLLPADRYADRPAVPYGDWRATVTGRWKPTDL